jgi:TetR/AcrR family transcriptional regulator, cholesterol catabolism regulator
MSSDVSKIDQIRMAAVRLFRDRGFAATSVRDIAESVGIQGGSLYAHIESKDDLLWDIVNHSADGFFAAIEPIAKSDQTVMLRLRQAIIAHIEVITADLDAAAVYSTEWRHLPAERRSAFATRRDAYEQIFRDMIGEGMRERLLATSDEVFATLFVLSALNWVYQWFKPDGRLTAEELGTLMADYIFDGLRRRSG